jgi:hypothetical protein
MPTPGSIVAIGSRHGKITADAEGREGSSVQIVPAIELSCSCLGWRSLLGLGEVQKESYCSGGVDR